MLSCLGLEDGLTQVRRDFFHSTLFGASYFCHPGATAFHMESLSLVHGQLFQLMFFAMALAIETYIPPSG